MVKKLAILVALIGSFSFVGLQDANAWRVVRRAPVRRAVARTVLPPYPVARRVVAGPVLGPRYIAPPLYGPAVYGPTVVVGPGVYVY